MIASRFELVIFDCDGVLVDSEPIINRAHAELLTTCGYPIAEHDLVERFCGMSDPEMLAIIERELGRALPLSYTERVDVMIENGFCRSLAAIEGVAEALDALRLPICVASSSAAEQIRRKLELAGLLDRFGQNNLFQCGAGRPRQASTRPVLVCCPAPRRAAGPVSRDRG
jgi:beta-phosphoglucomutase-like phosphatase (HAD superfamily)